MLLYNMLINFVEEVSFRASGTIGSQSILKWSRSHELQMLPLFIWIKQIRKILIIWRSHHWRYLMQRYKSNFHAWAIRTFLLNLVIMEAFMATTNKSGYRLTKLSVQCHVFISHAASAHHQSSSSSNGFRDLVVVGSFDYFIEPRQTSQWQKLKKNSAPVK